MDVAEQRNKATREEETKAYRDMPRKRGPSARHCLALAGGSAALTSTTGLMTDGRPRRTSLCSFSVKHSGTLPTSTRGAPVCGSSSCRPRLRRGD
ncbi:hypothetical protein CRUP_026886 [Coryphaenoides rupestris]|nr:hypothetical protein CRUP_026886 [Coryphaenoides rupestris]